MSCKILISKYFYIFGRFCYELAVLFWFIHVIYFWTNIYRVDSMCETPSVFGGQRATMRQTDIKDEIILPSQECVGLYNYLSGKDS